jgi:hypothetical protein
MSQDPRLLELLDAELDGLLDAAGATELAGRLAAEPDARAARASLQKMHAALAALPEQPVPAGLRAAVLGRLPAATPFATQGAPESSQEAPGEHATNLSGAGRYVIAWPRRAYRARQLQSNKTRAAHPQTHSHTSRPTMNRSKILASGAVAAAVGAVLYFGVLKSEVPPGDTFGTIAPAQRYQAQTVGAADVKLGDEGTAKFMQSDVFRMIQGDAKLAEAMRSDTFRAALASDSFRAALASDAFRAALASDGFRAAMASESFRAALASDSFRAALSSDAFRAAMASEAFRAQLASDSFRAALASDSFRAAMQSEAFRAAMQSEAFRAAMASESFRAALASDSFRAAMASESFRAALASDSFRAALASDSFRAALASDSFRAALASESFRAALASDSFRAALASDSFRAALASDSFRAAMASDSFRAAMQSDAFRAALQSDANLVRQ